jgi:cholesterol oxidase
MAQGFDVVVVGSGFGGAVTACRLAEAGARVLVLERGRRWSLDQHPRKPGDAWIFKHSAPHKLNGWLDLRLFKGMAVALGAGVGGGSLCYSSVVMEADPERFESGAWPPEITFPALVPYYDKVRPMLGVGPIPQGQRTHRYQLLQKAAEKLGYSDRFASVPLAVSFDPAYNYDLPDPLDSKHSKSFINAQGQQQGTCIHLGNCDIGCDVRAKNTLDLNYIALAERHGAEVRPLHLVRYLEPIEGGYRVVFDRIEHGRLIRGEEHGERVVLAAGSLGSTEILLRCRDEYKTLPALSPRLGEHWSANANFLTPDLYPKPVKVNQGIGPTISAGLNFMDGAIGGHRFFIEDDGFPNLYLNAVITKLRLGWLSPWVAQALGGALRRGLNEKNPTDHVMVWLGEGLDAADGRLFLGRSWLKPWEKELKLQWNIERSKPVIDAIVAMHKRFSESLGGQLQVPLYWSLLKSLLTVHPLGGCKMGRTREEGVVDHRGAVFGYQNLHVADGAILPEPTGRNPSMTIAALAERVADLMIQ